jgi:ribosomal protein L15E
MPTKTTSKKSPPWKRKSPKRGKSKPLSESQKSAARIRAKRAGRRYPNLVDNMWAASKKKSAKK